MRPEYALFTKEEKTAAMRPAPASLTECHLHKFEEARVPRVTGKALAALVTTALLAAATTPAASAAYPLRQAGASSSPGFEVRASVHQVAVIKAPPGKSIMLDAPEGKKNQKGTVDENGGYLFRNVEAGDGYQVVLESGGKEKRSKSIAVLNSKENPPPSFYKNQKLKATNRNKTSGYGYLKTRDGTTLSVQVVLPGPVEDGPYPAVVEYSGYDPSNPGTGQPQYKLLVPPMGIAWIGVNIRGTGCSGGAFNFFETLQTLDGYDAIETVAAQPWSNGRVGMVGISYGGISQLFVAQTRPPHLDVITPLSVIDDTWRGTLYPGGIFNDGFALGWTEERLQQNKWPNPDAPTWVQERIDDGDKTCADNMLLRGQNVDLIKQIDDHPYTSDFDDEFRYDFPDGTASLAPEHFVHKIKARTFIAGSWQDEQTGGHWANILNRFSPNTDVRVVGQNGVHIESLDPAVLQEMTEFLQLYLSREVPELPPLVIGIAPQIWAAITGIKGVGVLPDRFPKDTTYKQALKTFEAEPPVAILWETGNAPGWEPGAPMSRAVTRHAAWPIPGTRATPWFLQPNGGLASTRSTETGNNEYHPDPNARPRTNLTSGNVWSADPPYKWEQVVDGASLAYITEPLTENVTMAGTGSVDLRISSSTPDNDLQVTLSEVREDGSERYIQNGWLRLSERATSSRSTVLNPFHPDTKASTRPMPKDRFVTARVALFPFAHQFRVGTRIRLTIEAPGGDRPEWTFGTPDTGGSDTVRVAYGGPRPSRVVLPVIDSGPDLGAAPAPCPSLRAQPCRSYATSE